MQLVINGERREVTDAISVRDLATLLGLPERGVAIAVDDTVVPRAQWQHYGLAAEQRIEVLTAVQGG